MSSEFISFKRFDNELEGRIRLASLTINAENFEREIIEFLDFLESKTPHAPFTNSIFLDSKLEEISIPVTGPRRALTGVSKNYIVSDVQFREIESFKNGENLPKNLEQDEFSELLRAFLQKNPKLNEKKLLLELNSKYLALHFFL